MKKLLFAILAMLLTLTACTADGTTPTVEETALPPTEVVLETAATATAEPTATTEPTAEPTATTEPEPTETAEPTATPEPTATLEETAPSDYEGTIPNDVELPEGSVVIYGQYGGFAGFDNNWVFYADGRVTLNGVDQTQLTPERIQTLVDDLAALDFFETNHLTKPGEFCCDFFDYTLAVQSAERQNFISYSDGNLNLPNNIKAINALMFDITNEAQVR